MPRDNVEAIRGVYARWGEGDFGAAVELFDPDVSFVMGPGFPDSGTYVGLEGIADYMHHFLEPWTWIVIEAEQITDAGEHVIAAVRQHGVGVGSGAETEFRYFQVWTFGAGKVTRLENARTEERVRELTSSKAD